MIDMDPYKIILMPWITEKSLEFLKLLIEEKGADVNLSDVNQWSPLHFCCKLNRKSV